MTRDSLPVRLGAVLFTVFVVVSMLAVISPVAAQSSEQTAVAISNVTASTDTPTAGEPFSLRVTIANFEGSQRTATLNDLTVEADGERQYIAENLGQLPPGSRTTVTVPVTLDDPGQHTIALELYGGTFGGGVINTRAPFVVDVRELQRPSLGFTLLDPDTGNRDSTSLQKIVSGETRKINVTVANGNTESLRNVRLRVNGTGGIDVTNARRVDASLAAGKKLSHTFRVTFPQAGTQSLDATLTYETTTGKTRTVSQAERVDIEQAASDVTLDVSNQIKNGSSVIRAELQQFGNVDLHDVQIRAFQDDTSVVRTTMPDVPAKGLRTVSLDSSTIPSGAVTVVAEFTVAGEQRMIRETLDYTNDVELDVSNQIQNGSSIIRAELQQFGNVELRDVEIRAESDGETVARVPLQNILGEGARTVALRDDEIPSGNVIVVAAYTVGSERQTTTASLLYSKYSPAPTSAITLTGLELTRQGDVLTLDGDAANVGTSQVNSVVISVVKTDVVRPVSPNREYFINQIGPNEFANFEATAQVPANINQIPVRVQYTVDGQRVSSIIPLDITDIEVNSGNNQNGGPSPFAVGIVLLVVAIAGVGVYRWRNQ